MKRILKWIFYSRLFQDIRVEHYHEAYQQGRFDRGMELGDLYRKGQHEGMIANTKGLHLNHNGLYVFENGSVVETVTSDEVTRGKRSEVRD